MSGMNCICGHKEYEHFNHKYCLADKLKCKCRKYNPKR